MTILSDLRIARSYIEKGWCRKSEALNIYGERVSGIDREATSWCIVGALMAANVKSLAHVRYLRDNLMEFNPDSGSLIFFNDTVAKNKEEVLGLFDRAIGSLTQTKELINA